MLRLATGRQFTRRSVTPLVATFVGGRRLAATSGEPNPVLPMGVVTKMASVTPLFGNGGYLMLASGFLMTDPLLLRCLMVSGYGSITAYHSLQLRPLRIPLCGSIFFVAVNSYFAGKIISERYVTLTEEEATIYAEHFEDAMDKFHFKKLMEHAEVTTADKKAQVIGKKALADLVLIIDGQASVDINPEIQIPIKKGQLIGEMSLLEGCNATADVYVLPGCRYIKWKRKALEEFFKTKDGAPAHKGIDLKVGREVRKKLVNTTNHMVREHSHASEEHHDVRVLEYEHAVMVQMFAAEDSDGGLKRLFAELAKYRIKEGVKDDVHNEVMHKLNINEENVLKMGLSIRELKRLVAIAGMPHVRQ